MKCCEVRSCNSQNDPNRMYHKFPCDPPKRKEWFQILGLKKNDQRAMLYVCGKHFRFKDYCSGGKRLKPEAVPCLRLNINSHQASSKPTKDLKVKAIKVNTKIDPLKTFSTSQKADLTRHNTPKNVNQSRKPLRSPLSNHCKGSNRTKMAKIALNKSLSSTSKNNMWINSRETKQLLKNKPQDKQRYRASSPGCPKKQKGTNGRSKIMKRNSPALFSVVIEESSSDVFESRPRKQGRENSTDSPSKSDPITSTPNEKTKDSKTKLNISLENTSIISTTFTVANNIVLENGPENLFTSKLDENRPVLEVKPNTSCEKIRENSYHQTIVPGPKSSGTRPNSRLENETERSNILTKTEKQNVGTIPKPISKNNTAVGGSEETTAPNRARRQRTKRKRLISTDSESCEKDGSNLQKKVCSNSRPGGKKSSSLTQIEKTIKEMQQKIDQLEKKSILDEKRIEAFKNALIKQRNHDIKVIMDEKENELLLRMELLYLDFDPQKICRLCLLQVDSRESLTSLFLPQENLALLSMIKSTINIEIKYDENMPMGICGECMIQIQRIDWMQRKSHRSNSLIHKFTSKRKGGNENSAIVATADTAFGEDKYQREHTFEENNISEVKIEEVFSLGESDILDIKQEPLSDEEFTIDYVGFDQHKREKDPARKCRACRATFTRNWSWNCHVKWCRRVFQCAECSKCFWNGELFARHRKYAYACRSALSLRTCDQCDVVFRRKYQYLFHLAAGVCH